MMLKLENCFGIGF